MRSKRDNELNWTPAALAALMRGDYVDALTAATPGGIEAQEARGQRDFVASETLPKRIMDDNGLAIFAALGIQVHGDADDLFYKVTLPTGWHKQATDHSMHSSLMDDKGRRRAGIFYKAAFYDRAAHISFSTRYSASYEPVGGWDTPREERQYYGVIRDGNTVIWQGEPQDDSEPCTKEARARLTEMYPDWRNVLAYWED